MKKFFYTLLIFLLFLSISQSYSQNYVFDSLANEINKLSLYKETKSRELLDSLYYIALNSPDSSFLIARCIFEEANLAQKQGKIDTTLTTKIYNQLSKENQSVERSALLQLALGAYFMSEGKYSDAFSIFLKELETFKNLNENDLFIIRIYNYLGIICGRINLNSLAIFYYSEALVYTTPNSYEYFYLKTNTFSVRAKDYPEETIDSLVILMESAEKENCFEILTVLYLNIGSNYLRLNPEKAIYYFEKLRSMDFDSQLVENVLSACMGGYYLYKKDNIKSLEYFRNAKIIMEEKNDFTNLPVLYSQISSVFEEQNMLDSALYYSNKSIDLFKTLYTNTIAIETHQKYITTFLKIKENELIISEQKNVLKQRQIIIIVVVSLSSILLILFFLLYINRQKQLKIVENRELSAKLKHEQEVQQLEKEKRKMEEEKQKELLDAKIREITSYSLLVSEKNTLLNQIKDLNGYARDNKDKMPTLLKIDEIITDNLSIDNEWDNFKMHFDKVHPNFFGKLKIHSNDLTEENIKMCAYIKMGMTTKQIAQLLHVIPDSIIKSRWRLKKKLKLSEEESLKDFVGKL